MIDPTGKGIRGLDTWGSGAFGASRGKGKKHKGLDFGSEHLQDVLSPFAGRVTREAWPYKDDPFLTGMEIETDDGYIAKIFYVLPDPGVVGTRVESGEVIGTAQSLEHRYPGISPHVHVEVRLKSGELVDPETLLLTPTKR